MVFFFFKKNAFENATCNLWSNSNEFSVFGDVISFKIGFGGKIWLHRAESQKYEKVSPTPLGQFWGFCQLTSARGKVCEQEKYGAAKCPTQLLLFTSVPWSKGENLQMEGTLEYGRWSGCLFHIISERFLTDFLTLRRKFSCLQRGHTQAARTQRDFPWEEEKANTRAEREHVVCKRKNLGSSCGFNESNKTSG